MRPACNAVLCLALVTAAALRAEPPALDPQIFTPDDTTSVKPLTRKLAVNLFDDQKKIWTSPFRVNRHTAVLWGIFTAATAALIATDDHTVNTFENAPTQVRWANHISNVGSAYTVVPIAAGFYAVGAIVDDAKARETGILGAEALLDGLIVQEVLKPIAGRDRPFQAHQNQKWFDGGASFPSGHSIAAWSLASVIAHEYRNEKWVPFVAYGLATVVGAARFTAQEHYASDVFAGSAIGWFIGTYVVENHSDRPGRFHPQISPILCPSAGTYGVSLRLGL